MFNYCFYFFTGGIDSTTKCVLTNAVYFKNVWKNVFDSERTIKKQFNIELGDGVHKQPKSVEVEFMHQSVKMIAGTNKTFKARWVKIPFDVSNASQIPVFENYQNLQSAPVLTETIRTA